MGDQSVEEVAQGTPAFDGGDARPLADCLICLDGGEVRIQEVEVVFGILDFGRIDDEGYQLSHPACVAFLGR